MLANLNAQMALRRTVAAESNQFFDLADLGAVRGIEWESLRRDLETQIGLDPLREFTYLIAAIQYVSSSDADDLFQALPNGAIKRQELSSDLTTLALFLSHASTKPGVNFSEVEQAVGAEFDRLLFRSLGALPNGDDVQLAYHIETTYEEMRFSNLRRSEIEEWSLSPLRSADYKIEFQEIARLTEAPDPLVVDDPASQGLASEVSFLLYDNFANITAGGLEGPIDARLRLLAKCLKVYEVLVKGERARQKMLSGQQRHLANQAKSVLEQAANPSAPAAPAADGGDALDASVLEETLRVLGAFQAALSDEWRVGGTTRQAFMARAEGLQRRLIDSAALSVDPASIYSLAPLASAGLSDADLELLDNYVTSLVSLHDSLEQDFLELEVDYSEVVFSGTPSVPQPGSFVLSQAFDLENNQKYLLRVEWDTTPPTSAVYEISSASGAYAAGSSIDVNGQWPNPTPSVKSGLMVKRGANKASAPEEVASFKKAFDELGELLGGGEEDLDKILSQVLDTAEQLNLEVSAVTAAQIRGTVAALSDPLSTLIKGGKLDIESLEPILKLLAGPGNTAKIDSAIASSGIDLGQLASIASDINAENNAAAQRIVQLLISLTDLHSKLREENVRHYTALSGIAKDEVQRWMTLSVLAVSFEASYREESLLFRAAPAGTKGWPTIDRDSDVLESIRRLAVYAGELQFTAPDPDGGDDVAWTDAAERLARGVEVLQYYQLMTSLNRIRAAENSIALIGEVAEHQIRVDDIVISGAELAISDNLDSLVAFHASGITDEDLRLLVGIVQQSLLIWIGTEV